MVSVVVGGGPDTDCTDSVGCCQDLHENLPMWYCWGSWLCKIHRFKAVVYMRTNQSALAKQSLLSALSQHGKLLAMERGFRPAGECAWDHTARFYWSPVLTDCCLYCSCC